MCTLVAGHLMLLLSAPTVSSHLTDSLPILVIYIGNNSLLSLPLDSETSSLIHHISTLT